MTPVPESSSTEPNGPQQMPPASPNGMPPQQPQYPYPMVPQPQYPYPMMPYAAPYAGFQVIDRVEKQVNQLPLVALLLSIFAWPLLLTASRTGNWDFFATVVAIPAIVLGHMTLAQRPSSERSNGYGLAIGALIISYLLLSISFTWAILRFL